MYVVHRQCLPTLSYLIFKINVGSKITLLSYPVNKETGLERVWVICSKVAELEKKPSRVFPTLGLDLVHLRKLFLQLSVKYGDSGS